MQETKKLDYYQLYDLFRREKTTNVPQAVPGDFYMQCQDMIRDIADPELHKNARRVLKDFKQCRCGKILQMAFNRSKVQLDLIDSSTLIDFEKRLYAQLVDILKGVLA